MEREKIKEYAIIQPGIYVLCGPMFSGKSDLLIQKLNKLPHAAGNKVQAFYPRVDDRREEGTINSYDGRVHNATEVESAKEIKKLVEAETNIVGIDEAQFFDMELVSVCLELAQEGKTVFVAGLDKDFRGEPFGPMASLKMEAEHVKTLHAYCDMCGGQASFTQRMIIERDKKGREIKRRPANYDDPLIVVAGDDKENANRKDKPTEYYKARCREHHEVPGKPKKKWIFVAEE